MTIHEIARELNFTPETVSKALNDNSRIGLETKRLVNEKSLELNYQQKNFLTSLRSINTLDFLINIKGIKEVKPLDCLQQKIFLQPFLHCMESSAAKAMAATPEKFKIEASQLFINIQTNYHEMYHLE